jgi:hypothetical protein
VRAVREEIGIGNCVDFSELAEILLVMRELMDRFENWNVFGKERRKRKARKRTFTYGDERAGAAATIVAGGCAIRVGL